MEQSFAGTHSSTARELKRNFVSSLRSARSRPPSSELDSLGGLTASGTTINAVFQLLPSRKCGLAYCERIFTLPAPFRNSMNASGVPFKRMFKSVLTAVIARRKTVTPNLDVVGLVKRLLRRVPNGFPRLMEWRNDGIVGEDPNIPTIQLSIIPPVCGAKRS